MQEALQQLSDLGVEWVAIHPYAGVSDGGSLRIHPTKKTTFLASAVDFAREANIQIFWKPHLAYWGSFSWRGAITYDSEEAWALFFKDYRRFILDQAQFAETHRVQLFAVGVELDLTVSHETEWRQLIADVRNVYSGQLTYAANWDAVDKVPFWDALDLIGVQAYFPLAESQSQATPQTISKNWKRHLATLRTLSNQHDGKRVLFTEIGYSRSPLAAQKPWRSGMDTSAEVLTQRKTLLNVALGQIEGDPMIAGMFWWKWMPGRAQGHDADFSMKDPEAREALLRYWGD